MKNRMQQVGGAGAAAGAKAKLHTIHGLLHGHVFDGEFEAKGETYRFAFTPVVASLSGQKLVLTGRFEASSRNGWKEVNGVEARLLASQGGVGYSSGRRRVAQASQTAPPQQEPEQKGPETELQPGLHAFEKARVDESGRPVVESTGALSFAGVLYFILSPLDGRALGVPLDLGHVQLGGRLAPTDNVGRELQGVFTDLAAALLGEHIDDRAANEQVKELNRIFKENKDFNRVFKSR